MATARYDSVADFYEAGWVDSYDDPVSTTLFDLLAPISGQRIMEVACGHGRIARELARRGADVTGVDISGELIAKARKAEEREPLGIRYHRADISDHAAVADSLKIHPTVRHLAPADQQTHPTVVQSGGSWTGFDAVVCSFGLSDIDDLDGALATINSLLKRNGHFVFSILHPCFPGGLDVSGSWPATASYHDEGWWLADSALSTLRNQVGANHRMLSTYINTLRRHNLWLDRLAEPPAPAQWATERPAMAGMPVYLVGRCVTV